MSNRIPTGIPGVSIHEMVVHGDQRGWLSESYREEWFDGIKFVQENTVFSKANVFRGLHYQIDKPQGKLLSVLAGQIVDVIVDIRPKSVTFKERLCVDLVEGKAIWIPPGIAHGFYAPEPSVVCYKLTEYYNPEGQRVLYWNDPNIKKGFQGFAENLILSERDKNGAAFEEILSELNLHFG